MVRRVMVLLAAMLIASSSFAQSTQDLEQRLKELQAKLSAIDEMKREIDILTQEIETLKSGSTKKAVEADQAQYGMGAAASKVYRTDAGVSIGGYGEFAYDNPRHEIARADLLRGVLYTGYKFSPRVLFNSELEVEHGTTENAGGDGAEGGSVGLEFAYLDYLIRPEANVRAGVMLMPVGLINEQHEPTAYFGVNRPLVEDAIIPTTWSEMGAGIFGDKGPLTYRAYVTTGLNSARFESESGIHEGKQSGAAAKAEDLAIVARADWHPFEGTMFGGSIYNGGSGQGAHAEDGTRIKGRVRLVEVHADSKFRGTSLRALFARGSVGDAALINEQNGLEGDESIGKSFGGWYVEGGYDLASRANVSITPYVRYERLDTQRSVPHGFERNPENNQRIFTAGFAFKPISQTVVKIDWRRAKNQAHTGDNTWNIGLGYIF